MVSAVLMSRFSVAARWLLTTLKRVVWLEVRCGCVGHRFISVVPTMPCRLLAELGSQYRISFSCRLHVYFNGKGRLQTATSAHGLAQFRSAAQPPKRDVWATEVPPKFRFLLVLLNSVALCDAWR